MKLAEAENVCRSWVLRSKKQCFRSSLGQVSFSIAVNLSKETCNVLQFGEIDWLQCSSVFIIICQLNRNKVGCLLCIQSVLEDGFMFTMWFNDFYWFLWFEMGVIPCVEDLVSDFRILPSLMWRLDLDDLAGNGMKKIEKSLQSSFASQQIRENNAKLRLDAIQRERSGMKASLWISRLKVSVGKVGIIWCWNWSTAESEEATENSINARCFLCSWTFASNLAPVQMIIAC